MSLVKTLVKTHTSPYMNIKMNILFACDSNYVMPLTVSLTSVFENNKESSLSVYVLHSPISKSDEETLLGLAKKYNQEIKLLEVAEHYFETAPVFTWSKTTYYRLLLNEYLPQDMKRILYLDCDTITNKPLDILYNLDLGEYYLMASEEKRPDWMIRLGLNPKDPYFQTGVMLIDLEKFKKITSYNVVSNIINELGKELFLVDEAVINILFKGKIKPIEQKYNNYYITNFNAKEINKELNIGDKKMTNETYIFHFTRKPWNELYIGKCEKIWYKYLLISPYKELYKKKFGTLKYKLLRTRISKSVVSRTMRLVPSIDIMAKKYLSEKLYGALRLFYVKNLKNKLARNNQE